MILPYEFHNPYNFINTPDRAGCLTAPFAGDHDPSDPQNEENHSRYWKNRYTGTIPVRLRTHTPLFITDPNSKKEASPSNGHYTYDCLDYIPATALKGMLSSAYEIITNSRYRVFGKEHKKRLGFRYPAEATLVPGRVEHNDSGWKVVLFTGTSKIPANREEPLCAAWLPTYQMKAENNLPKSGERCEKVRLRLFQHNKGFRFWSVFSIPGFDEYKVITPNALPVDGEQTVEVEGYVVVSGKIFSKKHDERFFFNEPGKMVTTLELTEEIIEQYEALIRDYQCVHEGGANPPIGGCEQGRHITDPGRKNLRSGDFVYVKTNGSTVQGLYPVQISRELHEKTPWECMYESLLPADSMKKLSPADRLFGWVSQEGSGAWKGKMRISQGTFKAKNAEDRAVHNFIESLPLKILGAPKPAQARFYLGDQNGKPQTKGLSKERAGYKTGKRLRGRKIYLHHALPQYSSNKEAKKQYWEPENGQILREYIYPQEETSKSNQNRSLRSWIERRKDFYFDLKVENLTREELGALLTLLGLGEQQVHFRLGYGKPLGLGSVTLSLVKSDEPLPVRRGSKIAEGYRSLGGEEITEGLSPNEQQRLVQDYKKAMVAAYPTQAAAGTENEPEYCDWKYLEFATLLADEDKNAFVEAWMNALEDTQKLPPLEALPSKDELFDLYPELPDELGKIYVKESTLWKQTLQCDFGWQKLSFIKDFLAAMKGFGADNNAPVVYPRNKKEPVEEGFQWFVENEKRDKLSLPEIGQSLHSY